MLETSVVMIGHALLCIMWGARMSLRAEEREKMKQSDAVKFPLMASAALLGIYVLVKAVRRELLSVLLKAYFCCAGALCVGQTVRPLFERVLLPRDKEQRAQSVLLRRHSVLGLVELDLVDAAAEERREERLQEPRPQARGAPQREERGAHQQRRQRGPRREPLQQPRERLLRQLPLVHLKADRKCFCKGSEEGHVVVGGFGFVTLVVVTLRVGGVCITFTVAVFVTFSVFTVSVVAPGVAFVRNHLSHPRRRGGRRR